MRPLGESLLAEKQKSDREQSSARGHEDKNENEDVTEVLLLGAGAQFVRRGRNNRHPSQHEHGESERIPGDDAACWRLKLPRQKEPNCGREKKRDNSPMPRILFGDPVHVGMF